MYVYIYINMYICIYIYIYIYIHVGDPLELDKSFDPYPCMYGNKLRKHIREFALRSLQFLGLSGYD